MRTVILTLVVVAVLACLGLIFLGILWQNPAVRAAVLNSAGTNPQPVTNYGNTNVATGRNVQQGPSAAQAAQTQPAYGLPPQPQIGHPSLYLETGVPCQNLPAGSQCSDVDSHARHWTIPLLPGTVAIIGGFKVDGVSDGVYKAIGSGTVDTVVTDGFIAITKTEWANAEFCFRVGQAVQYGWAHSTVQPLSGWAACQ